MTGSFQRREVVRGAAAILAVVLLPGCAHGRGGVPPAGPATIPRDTFNAILLHGGWVARQDRSSVRLELLLQRPREGGLYNLAATGENGTLSAPDTLDISGLYIHSTHRWAPEVNTIPAQRNFALYVVRTGPSPATPALWLIDRDVRKVTAGENHPPGPIDERVGCYTTEHGNWSNSRFVWDPRGTPVWFPDHLRLHWQYQWSYGGQPYLVATDFSGKVRGKEISWYRWRPVPPDSLVVDFGISFEDTMFRGAAEGRDYVGKLSVQWDTGVPVWAPARLHRVECPENGEK